MIAEMPAEAVIRPKSLRDLVRDLGDIPLERIRLTPPPGTATIEDVENNKCCELIDGVLVEKEMGFKESVLASYIGRILGQLVQEKKLGVVSGPDSTTQILPSLVRVPDVSFFSWGRFRGRQLPEAAVPELAPDLAIEVLSKGNTEAEMARKQREFFQAGVKEVWIVDGVKRTVTVWTSASDSRVLTESDSLDGGAMLPGLSLRIADLFAAPEFPA